MRKVLFMGALTAAKHDPKIRAVYQRLIAQGKEKLVAIVAVMRKMIVIGNAMLRHASEISSNPMLSS